MSSKEVLMAAAGAGGLPTFVSSSISFIGTQTNTVTAPSGIQNGDLLIALCVHKSSVVSLSTLPTGFKLITNDADVQQPSVAVAIKVASSESGNYSFVWSSVNDNTVAILVYRNATEVNTVSTIANATQTAPSITPTYIGVLCAVFSNNQAATVSTPPSGMTQRVFNGTGISLTAYDQSQTAVPTGDKVIAWNSTSALASFLLQITNEKTVAPEFVASASRQNTANTNSLSINKPTGTIENDLMVAFVTSNQTSGRTWTGDTGWTEVADQNSGTGPNLRIAYKVAGASEAGFYTFIMSSSANLLSGTILTYRYAAYDTIGAFTLVSSQLVLPSVSPTQSQSILVAVGSRNIGSIILGTPISMTARVTDGDLDAPSYKVCELKVAKGPTGIRTMFTDAVTTNGAGIMLSIKPTRSL